MVILAVGCLGIVMMQYVAQKSTGFTYLRQQAMQSAANIIDRVRANRQTAVNGSYNYSNLVTSGTPAVPSTPSVMCDTASCSSTELASYDIWFWLSKDVAQLPNGAGSLSVSTTGGNSVLTVIVQWSDAPAQNLLGANGQVSVTNSAIAQFTLGTSL
jgi:type IV pilus assembly protein PilV